MFLLFSFGYRDENAPISRIDYLVGTETEKESDDGNDCQNDFKNGKHFYVI